MMKNTLYILSHYIYQNITLCLLDHIDINPYSDIFNAIIFDNIALYKLLIKKTQYRYTSLHLITAIRSSSRGMINYLWKMHKFASLFK